MYVTRSVEFTNSSYPSDNGNINRSNYLSSFYQLHDGVKTYIELNKDNSITYDESLPLYVGDLMDNGYNDYNNIVNSGFIQGYKYRFNSNSDVDVELDISGDSITVDVIALPIVVVTLDDSVSLDNMSYVMLRGGYIEYSSVDFSQSNDVAISIIPVYSDSYSKFDLYYISADELENKIYDNIELAASYTFSKSVDYGEEVIAEQDYDTDVSGV